MDKDRVRRHTIWVTLALLFFGEVGLGLPAQQAIFADDWGLKGDGLTDDQAALKKLFHSVKVKYGTSTIIFSPKTYFYFVMLFVDTKEGFR